MAGIYIHIPFCKQACYYCDFHFSTTLKNKNVLLQSLLKEIEIRSDYLQLEAGENINTIYFGGGTPSLLSYGEIMQLFDKLHQHFTINDDAEISFEANPDDLTEAKLKELSQSPINRLSIGIQSFYDEDLSLMNRAHTASEAHKAVSIAQEHNFNNISIDLIYGIPSLTNENWLNNLEKAFKLNIQHISAYCLTVEEKTALAHMIEKGKTKNVSEQKSAEQFEIMLAEMKRNGFEQYEISNFCRNENYSIHNSNYWLKKKYIGIGPSAHSYNGKSRQWNVSNNNQYIKLIQNYNDGSSPWFETEVLNTSQQYNEYLLTSLRTIWGSDFSFIKNNFPIKYYNYLLKEMEDYLKSEHIVLNNNILLLSDKGKLIADKITSDLFYVD